jgi:hypothetical protein
MSHSFVKLSHMERTIPSSMSMEERKHATLIHRQRVRSRSANTRCTIQAIIANRSRHLDDGAMLRALAKVLEKYGALSGLLIDEEDGVPSSAAYRSRFGSLLRAYSLVGFLPKRDYSYLEINRALRKRHPEIMEEIQRGIADAGGRSSRDTETDLLVVNDEFTASLVIARCKAGRSGKYRWRIRFDASLHPDITVVVRMNRENTVPFDFYLLPSIDFTPTMLPDAESNGFALDAYQFDTLDVFYLLAARVPLSEAA